MVFDETKIVIGYRENNIFVQTQLLSEFKIGLDFGEGPN